MKYLKCSASCTVFYKFSQVRTYINFPPAKVTAYAPHCQRVHKYLIISFLFTLRLVFLFVIISRPLRDNFRALSHLPAALFTIRVSASSMSGLLLRAVTAARIANSVRTTVAAIAIVCGFEYQRATS